MPMDVSHYPPHWRELVAAVRERSGNRCEARVPGGRCMVRNGVWYHRGAADQEQTFPCAAEGPDCTNRDLDELAPLGETWQEDPIKVVLTTAHTCQDSTCDDLDHLAHWCQLHHLRYDAGQHARSAAETRRRKRIEQGQGALAL